MHSHYVAHFHKNFKQTNDDERLKFFCRQKSVDFLPLVYS